MSQLTAKVYSYLKEIDFLTAINLCNHLINWKSSNNCVTILPGENKIPKQPVKPVKE
jgi:hypothetical protein